MTRSLFCCSLFRSTSLSVRGFLNCLRVLLERNSSLENIPPVPRRECNSRAQIFMPFKFPIVHHCHTFQRFLDLKFPESPQNILHLLIVKVEPMHNSIAHKASICSASLLLLPLLSRILFVVTQYQRLPIRAFSRCYFY